MRPSRLVLASIIALSTLPAGSAMAQFPLPGIFGRVLGHMLPHPHWHRHYPAHHYAKRIPDERESRSARQTPAERASPPPGNEANDSTAVFWPQLGDDVTDYVFWPSGSDDHFWAHGYNDIVMGALRPESHESRESARASAASAQTTGTATAAPACENLKSSETADSVTSRIDSTIQPTDAQRAALNDLHDALQSAFDYVDRACPKAGPQTPTTRLDAMEDRIWAARQALLVTRAPLVKLYDSLTDEQKARLNGPSGQTATRGAGCSVSSPDLARMLQGRGRPDPRQRAGLEALRKTSDGLAKLLASACPATLPATPIERLDAADRRLNSMLYAVVTLRAPLDAMSSSPPPAQADPRMSRR
ncbi:MAG TPA: Spy/CpxP family protein refolding chaperone [Xanthobacteraceae bacterium]|nr:Spy/CpxP family protein refolding chaperone [Xanthobacteraceae bacterium]